MSLHPSSPSNSLSFSLSPLLSFLPEDFLSLLVNLTYLHIDPYLFHPIAHPSLCRLSPCPPVLPSYRSYVYHGLSTLFNGFVVPVEELAVTFTTGSGPEISTTADAEILCSYPSWDPDREWSWNGSLHLLTTDYRRGIIQNLNANPER